MARRASVASTSHRACLYEKVSQREVDPIKSGRTCLPVPLPSGSLTLARGGRRPLSAAVVSGLWREGNPHPGTTLARAVVGSFLNASRRFVPILRFHTVSSCSNCSV